MSLIGLTPMDIPTGHVKPPVTDETRRVAGNLSSQRQCTATRKSDGERCENAPIRGGVVCALHGGQTPLARRAAQKLLLSLVEPAVETLFAALQAVDGQGDPVWPSRVAAAKTLLSRAGFGEQAKLIVSSDEEDVTSFDERSLAENLEAVTRELRERIDRTKVVIPESRVIDLVASGDDRSCQAQP